VLSEGDGLRLLGELVHDKIVPKNAIPVFNNQTSYHLDNDGKIVMDTTIVTIMQVKEVPNATPCSSKRTSKAKA